jgi:Zn-dependent M28 family amino/carboxypeptidase
MTRSFPVVAPLLLLSLMTLGQAPKPAPTPSKTIHTKQLLGDLETLSADAMEGREPDTAGSAKARAYIIKRFKESALKPFGDSYLQSFTFSFARETVAHQGVNVIGAIKGKLYPQRYLVITAHYDHLGIRKGIIYNGADDNASGTAALFALADYFKSHPPDNSIIFAALDAEERSGAGGRTFVSHPPVNPEDLVLNVNLDMLCRDKNDTLYAVGTYHYPFLKPYLEAVARQSQTVKLRFDHDRPNDPKVEDWTKESDHYAFHREKIPFIYFGVEDEEEHHKPTDDFATITAAFYVHAVELVLEAVKQFDRHLTEIAAQKVRQPVSK